jgi:hypothetical protein
MKSNITVLFELCIRASSHISGFVGPIEVGEHKNWLEMAMFCLFYHWAHVTNC